MTLPTPGYGAPVPAPKRSKVPIVVLSVITGVFAALAVAGFVAFGIAIADTDQVEFATPGTVGTKMTPGTYVICQPADRALGPRTVQLDSTMVRVRSTATDVVLTDLTGNEYCDTFDTNNDDDLYEVLEFRIQETANYTVTVSDEFGTVSAYATVGRRISDSTFLWLGLGVLAALVAGACFLALIIVLIVRATRKPKPTWPSPGPGPGPGWGAPAWGQPMPGQPMPGQPMPGQPMPGQPMPGQSMPGQPTPGQPMPGPPTWPPPGPPPPYPTPDNPGPHPGAPAGPTDPWPPADPSRPPDPPPPSPGPTSG